MPIYRTFKKNAVVQAVVYGALTGLIGVIAFVIILQLPKEPIEQGEVISTSQQPTEVNEKGPVKQQFFALQHGVYSSFDSAAQFLASFPTLNKASIVRVGDQFFIWSKIDIEKVEGATQTVPSSFYKSITLSSSCPNHAENQLPKTLMDTKNLMLDSVTSEQQVNLPEDWSVILPEIQKLSGNTSVIRLHALINYYERLDCLKIDF
ncbi:translation initiation factor 2 [Solibacillus sp. R5-41]|uniref:translation initiation factor 2 n=1 Tax=Solibacillus sp. R5-41 TaxID=2048654 RepID=UPI000C128854|nr:translation initiation factor 2 [Solibacillus sp. R5-41]ATP41277.1 translation initiation factor 2 [Solibacillus sp. R5-41]